LDLVLNWVSGSVSVLNLDLAAVFGFDFGFGGLFVCSLFLFEARFHVAR
jgi:hypothetical protein